MATKAKTLEAENFAAHFAGGRLSSQPSNAPPQSAYRNPLDTFEYPSERLRREKAKQVERAKRKKGK